MGNGDGTPEWTASVLVPCLARKRLGLAPWWDRLG